MSETHRKPKVATEADLAELKARLERAQQGENTGEQSVVAVPTEPEVGTASDAVDAESQPTNASEVVAPLGYDVAIARRKEIRTYLDPIFAARAALIEQGDVKQGTFRREWFNAAKPLLDKAGYPVDSTLRQAEFFAIVAELQAEDRALKEQTASERAARKARAPREPASAARTPRSDNRHTKPSASGKNYVNQHRLDTLESRTRVWEIDSDEDDIVAHERARRAAKRAATVTASPITPAASIPNAHPTALPPEAYGTEVPSVSAHPTALPPEAYGTDADEVSVNAHPTALPPEAYGADVDDLDIFGTAHPTALPPEAYGVETDHDRELDTTIADARNRYAQLTAKDRISYFGRFLQGDSGLTKLLRRIPGVARIADSINKHQSRDKDAAQAEYEALVDGVLDRIVAETDDQHQKLAHRRAWMINESLALEQTIADYTKESSKDAGAFTNWWMSQEGKRFGKAKKAAVIAVGSAATAALATVFLPSVMFGLATGSLVGGITGGVVAHRVTKRRNNADVKVGRNAIMSHADYEAAYSMNDQYDAITQSGDAMSAAGMTTLVEEKSDSEMLRNRKRVGTAKGIGAAAGGLTGLGLGRLHELWDSHSQAAADAQSALEKADAAREAAEAKAKALQEQLAQQANGGAESGAGDFGGNATDTSGATEALRGNSFTVENGSGFVKEWGQWANLNGHKIDSSTASELHKAVLEKFGPDGVIDLKSLPTNAETYIQNSDLRIGAPGAAQWQPGVADFARDWLKSQGKW